MKFLFKPLLIFLSTLILSGFFAVNHSNAQDYTNSLPIGLTEEEKTRLDEIGIGHISTTPPPAGDIRNCAEWEPSEGVIIRYPFGLSYSVIAEMSEDLIVYTIVSSSSQQSYVTSQYNSNGVNMANVDFIIAPTDSYWTRDYGPWFIFDGNDDFSIVDPVYNRPRPNDDAIPQNIGTAWGIPVYGMDLITTGGNHMSDGLGTSISTTLVYDENPGLTEQQIADSMLLYLGNDYIVVEDALGEYIEHIDCWAKFLDPTTILVLEVPSYNSQYDELEAAADFFSQQISAWGRPYTVVRVYAPNGEPYTNSLILNDKVYVPMDNSSWDDDAIATYEAAMPGYEVLGFTGSWYSTDALHCRTMGVPDRDMLLVEHVPLFNTTDTENDYLISVKIKDYSETGLVANSLRIYYSLDGGAYQYTLLSSTADPEIFEGYIPAQPDGTTISYYIQAEDNSGRIEYHPYIGEPGAHSFEVDDMIPEIGVSPLSFSFESIEGDKEILTDDLNISNAGTGTLNWTVSNSESWLTLDPLSGTDNGTVQLEVNTNSLTAGTYNDNIIVSDPNAANNPQAVPVTLTIQLPTPEVSSTSPYHNETGVPIESDISVTFSISMDQSTLTWDNITVTNGVTPYTGVISYDDISKIMTIDIDGYFDKDDLVEVELSTTITSEQGVPLSGIYHFQFTTEINNPPYQPSDMIPADLAVDVPTDTDLSWNGGDPDEDPVTYDLYFGITTPPDLYAEDVSLNSYDLPVLDDGQQYYWYIIADDGYTTTTGPECTFTTAPDYICGDADGNEVVDVSDAVFVINYVFVPGSPEPDPYESGNVDCNEIVDVSDAVFIINFVFIPESPALCDCNKIFLKR